MSGDPKADYVMPTCVERAFINVNYILGFYIGLNMYDRLSILLGDNKLEKLAKSNILLAGVGGVGSFCF